jgi:nucleoside-triphosphatase THEP1
MTPDPAGPDFTNIDPERFAAVIYRPEDDIDSLLAKFALDLKNSGVRVGGVVQLNERGPDGNKDVSILDLASGRRIALFQKLGSGATSCRLDPAALAEASVALARAVADQADLVVVNKFSKQEAAGAGLRAELAEAILAGLPVLTGVSEQCLPAWTAFTGDRGTTLFCESPAIAGWWEDLCRKDAMSPPSDRAARGPETAVS